MSYRKFLKWWYSCQCQTTEKLMRSNAKRSITMKLIKVVARFFRTMLKLECKTSLNEYL